MNSHILDVVVFLDIHPNSNNNNNNNNNNNSNYNNNKKKKNKSKFCRLKYFVSELVKWSLQSMFTTSCSNKFHCFTVYGIKELL